MMKKESIVLLLVLSLKLSAQIEVITPQKITNRNLLAVDFQDDTLGIAVGEYGTIIKTQDGGLTWSGIYLTDLSDFTISSVEMLDVNTFLIACFNQNKQQSRIYQVSINTQELMVIYENNVIGENYELFINDGAILAVAYWEGIIRKDVGADTWQNIHNPTGTTLLEDVEVLEDNSILSIGNISGTFTYSMTFARTFEGNWKYPDISFYQNEFALTSYDYIHDSQLVVFTNQMMDYVYTDKNQLVLYSSISFDKNLGGWVGDSEVLTEELPGIVIDCYMHSTDQGLIMTNNGVYRIEKKNGYEYEILFEEKETMMNDMDVIGTNAIAVGENGGITIIRGLKWTEEEEEEVEEVTLKLADPKQWESKVYPNPAKKIVTIKLGMGSFKVRLFDKAGRKLREVDLVNQDEYFFSIADLAIGKYILKIEDVDNGKQSTEVLIKNE